MKKNQFLVIALTAALMLSFMSIISIQPASALDFENTNDWYLGGKWWYAWDGDNDDLAIILFGGNISKNPENASEYGVFTKPATTQYEVNFLNDLYANGLDVMSPQEDCYYGYSDNSWLTDIANLFKYFEVYDNIYIFGHSAGGVVVGYEIQKTYANMRYSAAVMASAPVDYTKYNYGPLFTTAQRADDALVRTSFICHQNDDILGSSWLMAPQMQDYYDNMVVDKEWHLNWGAEEESGMPAHTVQPDTCLDHYGETVTDVAYNWFLDPDISLTVYAMDGMGRPLYLSLYIDDEYVGTTWNTYQVKHGFHTIEVPDYSGFTFFACYEYDGSYHYNNPDNISITSAKNVMAWYY